METIANKIRCFIWKREFVLGSGFPILPILKATMLVDEMVIEKIYTISMLRTHALSKFLHVKVKQCKLLKLSHSEEEAVEYFLSLVYHFHGVNLRNIHLEFHFNSEHWFCLY